VLVASFAALAALWKRPRWERPVPAQTVLRVPRALEPVCGAIGVAVLALGVYAGLAGTKEAEANLLPTLVYVLFWVGVPFASALLGDVFRPFNPWLAIGRGAGWTLARVSRGAPAEPLPYPDKLGRWRRSPASSASPGSSPLARLPARSPPAARRRDPEPRPSPGPSRCCA
jgi:hypothetical protein